MKRFGTNKDMVLQNFGRQIRLFEPLAKKHKIDFNKVIRELNSYQRRYLGALLEILKEYKEIADKLYELTKNDKRVFSIFPKEVRKVPKGYKEIAKKWRINLNIDVVNIDEL